MFPLSLKHVPTPSNAEIVDVCRDPTCKFLLILFRDSIQIRTLNSAKYTKLLSFKRGDGSVAKYGYNKWAQWIDSKNLAIGTQLSRIIFLRVNKDSIEERDSAADLMITAHGAMLGFLVVAVDGPKVLFYSNDTKLKYVIEFENPNCDIIIGLCVYHFDDFDEMVLTFSNGAVKKIKVKLEKDTLKMIEICSLNFERDVVEVMNYNSKMIAKNKSGMLLLIDKYCGETVICENTSLFKAISNCDFVVSISDNEYLKIWSSFSNQVSSVKLYNENKQKIIACESDINGSRFFYATSSKLFLVIFAIQNHISPSMVFHTPDAVYFPDENKKIDADPNFLTNCFPITSFALSDDSKLCAVSGRINYCLYSEETKQWTFVENKNNQCYKLWFQNGKFFSVVYNFEKHIFNLLMFNTSLKQLFSFDIGPTFYNVVTRSNSILVICNGVIKYLKIKDSTIEKYQELKSFPSCKRVVLFNDDTFGFLTSEKQFIISQRNEIIMEGVTDIKYDDETGFLFLVSHAQEFIWYENQLIRLGSSSYFVKDITLYKFPKQYSIGRFKFDKVEYLSHVLIHFIEQPIIFANILTIFIKKETVDLTASLLHTFEYAVDQGYFAPFINALDHTKEKTRLLVTILLEVDQKHHRLLTSILPPANELIEQFPSLSEKINCIFSK